MVATALTAVILSQMVVALVSSQRVLEATMADVEISVQTRALREKLLFNICEDGGLMNTCKTDLKFLNENKGWGDGIEFKPSKGPKNRIVLGAGKKLAADKGKSKWLDCGTIVFKGTEVFGNVVSNGSIRLNLDMTLRIGTRSYSQKHLADSQLMNE